MLTLSTKLETVERKLEEKKKELPEVTEDRKMQVKEEILKLRQTRDKLNKQRSLVDEKLKEGKMLSVEEERRPVFLIKCNTCKRKNICLIYCTNKIQIKIYKSNYTPPSLLTCPRPPSKLHCG